MHPLQIHACTAARRLAAAGASSGGEQPRQGPAEQHYGHDFAGMPSGEL